MDEQDRAELQRHLEYFLMLLLAKLKQSEMHAQREMGSLFVRLGIGQRGKDASNG